MKLPPFTPIETERLRLRHFRESDLAALYAYRQDPAVARYQGWEPDTESEADVLERIEEMAKLPGVIQNRWFQIAVEVKATGELIGDCGIRLSQDTRQVITGYTFASAAQGKGFATEAMTALLNYLFTELAVHRVAADALAVNARSVRLLERLGFRREGYFLEAEWFEDGWADNVIYAILAREWRERHAS